jgi:hypothetical protein
MGDVEPPKPAWPSATSSSGAAARDRVTPPSPYPPKPSWPSAVSSNGLRCIRAILSLFADATVLVTNTDKCSVLPIRCTEDDVVAILEAFPGRLVPFPCTSASR